jgi:hypothetical protein
MAKDLDPESERNKADFSAYWSMKVRQFFSARRQYLEGADKKSEVDPMAETIQQLSEAAQQQQQQLDELKMERRAQKLQWEQEQVAAGTLKLTSADQAAIDVEQARTYL